MKKEENMRKNLTTKIGVIFSLIITILFNQISVMAATTYTIDNDDAQGHSNSSVGFSTYLSGTALYRGNARRQPSNSPSNGMYRWTYSKSFNKSGNIKATLKVYLNDYSFTDPSAKYYVNYGNHFVMKQIGIINQNTAPAGWSTVGTTTMSPIGQNQNHSLEYVELMPSGKSGYYTGADGIIITLS